MSASYNTGMVHNRPCQEIQNLLPEMHHSIVVKNSTGIVTNTFYYDTGCADKYFKTSSQMMYQCKFCVSLRLLERAAGIEPASSAWKAEVIAIIRCPHPETRLPSSFCNTKKTALFSIELISLPNQLRLRKASPESGGGGRIRTFEVDDGRFTVCSLWPLGNPTQIVMVPTTGIELVTY